MPDKRHHRGPHPQDPQLFAPSIWPALRRAVSELSWLLTRDYAIPSALKLVGDRHHLTERQRTAVMRCSCADSARESRTAKQLSPSQVFSKPLFIDGYNVLTTAEAALAGGVILIGRDGAWRDIASIHGTYRKVEETEPALQLVGQTLAALSAGSVTWYFDAPVSNSGRLAQVMREHASKNHWKWQVEIVPNPDLILSGLQDVVVTADSVILDRCSQWFNLVQCVLQQHCPNANIVDLSIPASWSMIEGSHQDL